MKTRVLIQVILITLAIHSAGCTDSSDKQLWGQAESGMTPAQVLKVFPDAKKNPKPTFSPHNNSQSHVIIPTKLIHGVDFKVSFSFNSTGLVGVGFHSKYSSKKTASLMESLLSEKYGAPAKIIDNTMTQLRKVEWYDTPVSILLSYYGDIDGDTDGDIDGGDLDGGDLVFPSLFITYDHFRYDAVNSL